MPVENDARMRSAQKPLEGAFANLNRLPAQVFAVEFDQVESAEGHSMILAPIADQVEHRKPIVIDGDGLTIDHA